MIPNSVTRWSAAPPGRPVRSPMNSTCSGLSRSPPNRPANPRFAPTYKRRLPAIRP